jgi:hypothetical protein
MDPLYFGEAAIRETGLLMRISYVLPKLNTNDLEPEIELIIHCFRFVCRQFCFLFKHQLYFGEAAIPEIVLFMRSSYVLY